MRRNQELIMTIDSIPLLDLTTINELKDIVEEGIFEIYHEYDITVSDTLSKISDNINNTDKLAQLSHTIKGSSGSIGLERMRAISETIEHGLRDNEDIDIDTLVSQLTITFSETIKALKDSDLIKQ